MRACAAAHPDLVVVGPGIHGGAASSATRLHPRARRARLRDAGRAARRTSSDGAVALGVLTNHAEAGRALALALRRKRERLAKQLAGVAPLTAYVDAGFGTEHPAHDAARAPDRARRREGSSARPTASRPSTQDAPPAESRRLHRNQHKRGHARRAALAPRPAHAALGRCGPRLRGRSPAARADTTAYSLMRSLAHALHPAIVKR